jgi:hypothetical protein
MNYIKSKDMDLTYREILKWGDKREAEVEPLMRKLIKEKFGLTDSDFRGKHLPGTETVKLDKPSMLKPSRLLLKSISGSKISTDDFTRAKYSCGKFYDELLDLLNCAKSA